MANVQSQLHFNDYKKKKLFAILVNSQKVSSLFIAASPLIDHNTFKMIHVSLQLNNCYPTTKYYLSSRQRKCDAKYFVEYYYEFVSYS